MSTTLTIAKREFRSNFDSPLAYVVICIGLIALGFVFFYLNGGFWQADRASLQTLFVWAPRGLSYLVIPVVTMRLLAEEKRSGTLEMLITLPVKDHEVILGKFLGAWGLVLLLIAAAVSIGLLISALTETQVIAVFVTFVVLFVLHAIGGIADSASPLVRDAIAFISFDARLAPFARGMVSTRDIVFFLSITVGCLMAAFRALERRKWA